MRIDRPRLLWSTGSSWKGTNGVTPTHLAIPTRIHQADEDVDGWEPLCGRPIHQNHIQTSPLKNAAQIDCVKCRQRIANGPALDL